MTKTSLDRAVERAVERALARKASAPAKPKPVRAPPASRPKAKPTRYLTTRPRGSKGWSLERWHAHLKKFPAPPESRRWGAEQFHRWCAATGYPASDDTVHAPWSAIVPPEKVARERVERELDAAFGPGRLGAIVWLHAMRARRARA